MTIKHMKRCSTLLIICLLTCSVASDSSETPWTATHQAPLSMEFSRQEYWSGLPIPIPGDLPDPGIKPMSSVSPALQADSLPTEPSGKHKTGIVLQGD